MGLHLRIFILVFLSCCTTKNFAQFNLTGTVYDSTKINFVEGVRVESTAGKFTFTDSMGKYHLQVTEADSVVFTFRNKPTQKLTPEILKHIIEYQSGYNVLSIKDSETMLIEMSIGWGGEDVIEVIDYMCICLTSRSTNIEEANRLIKIFKNYSQTFMGYKAVLAELKTFEDFLTK